MVTARHNGHAMVEPFPDNPAWAEDMPELGRTEPYRRRVPDPDIFDAGQEQKELESAIYREAAQRCMTILNASLASAFSRLLSQQGTMREILTDVYSVLIAHGSFLCDGLSITQIADKIGVTKAALSHNAVEFAIGNGLPPSFMMRDSNTMRAYMEARLRSIEKENARHRQ